MLQPAIAGSKRFYDVSAQILSVFALALCLKARGLVSLDGKDEREMKNAILVFVEIGLGGMDP
jgi:hypothetical protein